MVGAGVGLVFCCWSCSANDSVLPWVLDAAANRWAESWTLENKAPALARLNSGGKLVGRGRGRTGVSVETSFTESLSVPVPNVP